MANYFKDNYYELLFCEKEKFDRLAEGAKKDFENGHLSEVAYEKVISQAKEKLQLEIEWLNKLADFEEEKQEEEDEMEKVYLTDLQKDFAINWTSLDENWLEDDKGYYTEDEAAADWIRSLVEAMELLDSVGEDYTYVSDEDIVEWAEAIREEDKELSQESQELVEEEYFELLKTDKKKILEFDKKIKNKEMTKTAHYHAIQSVEKEAKADLNQRDDMTVKELYEELGLVEATKEVNERYSRCRHLTLYQMYSGFISSYEADEVLDSAGEELDYGIRTLSQLRKGVS